MRYFWSVLASLGSDESGKNALILFYINLSTTSDKFLIFLELDFSRSDRTEKIKEIPKF